jgi:putative ABC transport system permease protein
MLWAATQRALVWDYEEGVYYAPLGAYCHMRLYARNLEGVEPLLNKVQELGIPSVANTFAIKRVFALERSLHNLFLIICMGAGIGAAVSYALSLFNAAELHRRDYAIVQLLGCGRISLVVMPFIDALLTSLASFFLSLGAYAVISSLISCMFAETAGGDVVCRLEYVHIFAFGFASLALAVVAAVVAAIKVLSVSPSEIIRES